MLYICCIIKKTMKTLRLHTEQLQPQEPKSLGSLRVYMYDSDLTTI